MENKEKCWVFLNYKGFDFISGLNEESYTYSDDSGYYHGADGGEGYIYSDGSGYYHGADGSEGHKYSDGSGYYSFSDGSSCNIEAQITNNDSIYSDENNDNNYDINLPSINNSDDYQIQSNDYFYEEDNDNDESNNNLTNSSGTEALFAVVFGFFMAAFSSYYLNKNQRDVEKAKIEEDKRKQREAEYIIRQENIKIKREKRDAFLNNYRKPILVVFVICIISMIGLYFHSEYKKRIYVGIDSSDLIGKNYKYASNIFA